MNGLMQDYPLTVNTLFRRGEGSFGHKHITSVSAGHEAVTTYADWADDVRRLAGALDRLGIPRSARVGSFAWNSIQHLNLYFAVPASGRVLHCINIRLFPEQISFVINHAGDEVIFVDESLLPTLIPVLHSCPTVKQVVVMRDSRGAADSVSDMTGIAVHDFDDLVRTSNPVEFEPVDEWSAAMMCYTSGTTGDPKGVVYSHRSVFLHSMAASNVDTLGVGEADRILPLVPMFHANAWGIPHAAIAQGAELVLPGSDLSGPTVADLIVRHRVTMTAGVPTIWISALPHLEGRDVTSLRLIACGGAAVPAALSEDYRTRIGLPIQQAWGMTETSPLAAVGKLDADHTELSDGERAKLRTGVGRPVLGVEARLVRPGTLDAVAHDGVATGELQVRGPWIASNYYGVAQEESPLTEDGWLRSGDVATMDERGWIRLVDRTKDLIKSGGEWISPADLENELMNHPAVAEAAVVGVPHPRWSERPLACVVRVPGQDVGEAELLSHLSTEFARWQLPDRIVFVDSIPKTSVGKFAKREMRELHRAAYADVQ
jgi:fatty-acyl-CoA synthase